MIIQEAGEMYLETILRLKQKTGAVRSVDIAREMGYSKPTVSEQMKKFRENGLIEIDEDSHINLTEAGMEIAKRTLAEKDACRLEHYMSEETFRCIKKHFGMD